MTDLTDFHLQTALFKVHYRLSSPLMIQITARRVCSAEECYISHKYHLYHDRKVFHSTDSR